MREATVILISHRVTSLMGADEILVLNQGKIEERGSHRELIQRNGIYRRIYEIQMSRDDRVKMEMDATGGSTACLLYTSIGNQILLSTQQKMVWQR